MTTKTEELYGEADVTDSRVKAFRVFAWAVEVFRIEFHSVEE